MLRIITATILGTAAAALIAAPIAAADTADITNADIAETTSVELLLPGVGGPHPYATGYNISPRYEFTTDPVTGDRRAKYDNGCNGSC